MCYPLLKIHIQIFSTPKELNGGEFPHNTHFLNSSIIILYSGELILNKIHFTNKYLNYKLGYKNIGLICPTKYFHKKNLLQWKINSWRNQIWHHIQMYWFTKSDMTWQTNYSLQRVQEIGQSLQNLIMVNLKHMYVWGHFAHLRAEHPRSLAGGGLKIHHLCWCTILRSINLVLHNISKNYSTHNCWV